MKKTIKEFFDVNFKTLPKKILVAVSGGADSMALTFMLKEFCDQFNIEIFAVTIDHKIRKNSDLEAKNVGQILTENKINHQTLEINEDNLSHKNIEAELRQERYSLLYDFAIDNEIDSVFVGHHKNDLAENFLIRIFRGSQLDGLSPMNEVFEFKDVKIYRPLLEFKKQDLIDFLRQRKISWFEDETNEDESFLRNKIRKFFDSFEEKDLIIDRISKASELLKESKDFENQILLEKAKEILIFLENGSFLIDFEKYKEFRLGVDFKDELDPSSKSLDSPLAREISTLPQGEGELTRFLNGSLVKKSPYSKIMLKILSLVLVETSGQIYKPRLEKLKQFEQDLFNLEKGKKRNFYGCFAKILTKSNIDEIADFIDIRSQNKVKENPERFMIVYLENDDVKERFLINKNGERRFYFRTILSEIFKNSP